MLVTKYISNGVRERVLGMTRLRAAGNIGETLPWKETGELMLLYQGQVNSECIVSPLTRGSNNPAGR